MRFINVVLNLFMISICFSISNESIVCVKKMIKEKRMIENKVCSTKFISKSFIKTCEGNGFSSFNEWQEKCKALFCLESIEWTEITKHDYKEENKENSPIREKKLFTGKWKGNCSSGEIFCREN